MRKSTQLCLSAWLVAACLISSDAWAGTVNITMRPPRGQAYIMTVDLFLKCRARGVDGWNREVCPGWSPLMPGPQSLLGQFCIQAWWSGNETFRGGLNMRPTMRSLPYPIEPQPRGEKGSCI